MHNTIPPILSLRQQAQRLIDILPTSSREDLELFSEASIAIASSIATSISRNSRTGLAGVAIGADNGQALTFIVGHPAWASSHCSNEWELNKLSEHIEQCIVHARAYDCLRSWGEAHSEKAWSMAASCCELGRPGSNALWADGCVAMLAQALAMGEMDSENVSAAATAAFCAMLSPLASVDSAQANLVHGAALDAMEALLAQGCLPVGAFHAAMAFSCSPSASQRRAWNIVQSAADQMGVSLDQVRPSALSLPAKPAFPARGGMEATNSPLFGKFASLAWLAAAQASSEESADIAILMADVPEACSSAGFPSLAPRAVSTEHPLLPVWSVLENSQRAKRPLPPKALDIALTSFRTRLSSWAGYFPQATIKAWRSEGERVMAELSRGVVPDAFPGRASIPLISEEPPPVQASLSPLAWAMGFTKPSQRMEAAAFSAVLKAQQALGYSTQASLEQCEKLGVPPLSEELTSLAERAAMSEMVGVGTGSSPNRGPRL